MAVSTNLSNNTALATNVTNVFSFIDPLVLKIVTAIIIVFMGIVIAKIIEKLMLKLFELAELDKLLKLKFSLSKVLARLFCYTIYIIAIAMALNTIGITRTVITVITLALIVLLIVLFVFGANDFLANFVAGLALRLRKNIKVGAHIHVKDKNIDGHILSLELSRIRLETGKDEIVYIPHMALLKSGVKIIHKKSND